MVFGNWETAEVFLWEVKSAVPAAKSVSTRAREQFQIQNRQNKCLLGDTSDAVLPGELRFGWERLGAKAGF